MYTNFKFCNSQGKRLAVFAEKTDLNKTLIWILTCSKKDSFSKKRAREVFNNWKRLGKAFYITKKALRNDFGEVVRNNEGKVILKDVVNNAHPEVITLDVPFQQERVNFYLKALYYKFIPKTRLTKMVNSIRGLALSFGKYIEK